MAISATSTLSASFTGGAVGDEIYKAITSSVNQRIPEPAYSALSYTMLIGNNPDIDDELCKVCGKVCAVIAKFKQEINTTVRLCGQIGDHTDASKTPIAWHNAVEALAQEPIDPKLRMFLFHIPPNMNDERLELKLLLAATTTHRSSWENGVNHSYSLAEYGHHVIITIDDVTFAPAELK